MDLAGDVLHEQVRFIGSSHTALDGSCVSVVGSDLVFSLGDMLANKQVGSTFHVLFVHGVDGSLSGLAVLERDVALVLKLVSIITSSLNMSRCNFAKLGKHTLKLIIIRASRQALNKEIEEATGLTLALLTSLMSEHLNLLAVEL